MLSDIAIRAVLNHDDADQRLVVCPMLDAEQIGSASIDLRLGTEFMEVQRTKQGVLDPFSAHDEQRFNVAFGNQLIIHPGQFLLGSTLEYLRVPRQLAGQILNRSSWAPQRSTRRHRGERAPGVHWRADTRTGQRRDRSPQAHHRNSDLPARALETRPGDLTAISRLCQVRQTARARSHQGSTERPRNRLGSWPSVIGSGACSRKRAKLMHAQNEREQQLVVSLHPCSRCISTTVNRWTQRGSAVSENALSWSAPRFTRERELESEWRS